MTLDLGKLRADLERDEGVRFERYLDTLGNITVAIGHLMTPDDLVNFPDPLSQAQVDSLYAEDIAATISWLRRNLPWWFNLPEPAARGVTNCAFAMRGKLLEFVKMIDALQLADFETAAMELLDSLWAREVGERANRIAALFRSCAPNDDLVA